MCLVFISVSSAFLLCISNFVVLTQSQIVASVAETNGLKNKQVKGVVEALFACGEIIDMTPYVEITFVIIWQHSKNEIIFPFTSSMFKMCV